MKRLLCIAVLMLTIILCYSQNKSLTVKLINADSVLLVSHQSIPYSSIRIVDSAGEEVSFPLLKKCKLNNESVQERVLLTAAETKRLAQILSYRKDNEIIQGGCFDPHHAIIIYKKGKLSFIDLCFGCANFSASKDINLTDIQSETWDKLYAFFTSRGIKYAMQDDISATPHKGF